MKKIIFIILFFPSLVLSQWITQVSPGSIKDIYSNSFINSNTGWLSGKNGRISKTTSGGLYWQTDFIDSNIHLYSIKFVNANTGFVCGMNGKIFKTTNGGSNWILLTSNVTDTLRSLDFVNANTGWCVGYYNVLKTTNSGVNWFKQYYDTSVVNPQFMEIDMYDSQNGLTGGPDPLFNNQSALMFRTSDGGNNWLLVDSLYGYYVASIDYVTQDVIFLSTQWVLFKSTDGGLNWDINTYNTYPSPSYTQFKDINTGWRANENYLFKTTNGGNFWYRILTIHSHYYFCGLLFDLPGSSLYAIKEKGVIVKSTNEGLNWGNYSVDLNSSLYYVRAFDDNTCMVFGAYGTLSKTSNGGINWNQKYRDNLITCTESSFINNNTGWVIGGNRGLIKTTDNGENWVTFNNMFPRWPLNIFCEDENNFWVVGDSGMVLNTTDSGNNWINKSPDTLRSFNWIRVVGNNVLLASNSSYAQNSLYRSTNSGNNWTATQFYLIFTPSLSFINEQTGWLFGRPYSNNVFYKTTNSGNNWIRYYFSSQGNSTIHPQFIDENTGYSIGSNFSVLKTTNGGFNWFLQSLPHNVDPSDLFFINPFTGWVVNGSFGYVFKTTNGGSTYISVGGTLIPDDHILHQNYPNPFNPSTKIKFQIVKLSDVKLIVFDILGREVGTLVNEKLKAGTYEVEFDARHGGSSSELPSGVYFYTLITMPEGRQAESFKETKKMILIK